MPLRYVFLSLLAAAFLLAAHATVDAQRRDYLTDDEVEIVRDAQQIDLRVAVLAHAVDRRLTALGLMTGETPDANKKEKKDSGKWGAEPTGTRLELLDDVRRIIQKAVDDIDNLAERPDSIVVEEPGKGQKPKKYEDVFPKAVHVLAAAAKRYEPILKREIDISKDDKEKGVIMQSLDLCNQIIDAETRLPSSQAKKSNN
jgi:hypothetical protein